MVARGSGNVSWVEGFGFARCKCSGYGLHNNVNVINTTELYTKKNGQAGKFYVTCILLKFKHTHTLTPLP